MQPKRVYVLEERTPLLTDSVLREMLRRLADGSLRRSFEATKFRAQRALAEAGYATISDSKHRQCQTVTITLTGREALKLADAQCVATCGCEVRVIGDAEATGFFDFKLERAGASCEEHAPYWYGAERKKG